MTRFSQCRGLIGWIAAVFALALLAVPASAQQLYKIRPGDQLNIEVLEDPSLNRSVLILPDGNFTFPFAGQVRAGGRSVLAVQNSLVERLSSNFATPPSVFVTAGPLFKAPEAPMGAVEIDKFGIYAMGEINNPGKVEILSDEGITLLQAIAQVGGFTRFAATKRIELRRPTQKGEQVYIYNYKTGGGISGATTLRAGDVIVVPERRLFE
ncbi:polysaccharide biosynthesis/export family protein [Pseudooceanicola onchidii]|uniref:polysaccharide biosynthesis/export family protein n=1 Tax=Pseudooceanicola onchidii TaxID=2562279 RepID=UPI0010AB265E|nr:polysaccharide biosynthesis/export family protein [Pseudooceanicola onchidii]